MNNPDEAAIWWLTQEECELIMATTTESMMNLPPYIYTELMSYRGRAGRGRLWVNSTVFSHDFQVPQYCFISLLGQIIENRCGGIVVRRADLHFLSRLPGLITDFNLERLGTAS